MDVITGDKGRAGVDAYDAPGEIVATLLRTAAFVRLRLVEFLERYELSEGRYSILAALDHAGANGLSQSEVAEKLMQSESNVSSLLDRLHREALVDRRWSNTDRRKRVLLLTADGQQLIHQVELARRRWADALLSAVSPHDRRVLADVMQQLPGHVESTVETESAVPPMAVGGGHITDGGWPNPPAGSGGDPNSPHFALERMLSTLGLAGHLAGDEE